MPTQNVEITPVGTLRVSSRVDSGSGTPSGGLLEADSVTGTNEAETNREANTKSLKPLVSAVSNKNWPTVIPPIVATMYIESRRPRVALVAMSLSHDSATTNRPAMHIPVTNLIRPQESGEINNTCNNDAPEAKDASAAKTRMCPT